MGDLSLSGHVGPTITAFDAWVIQAIRVYNYGPELHYGSEHPRIEMVVLGH